MKSLLTALFSLSALTALTTACTDTPDRVDAYDSLAAALGGGALDDTGAQHAAFMREEEKLARDMYLYLDARYDHRTFNHIARSEQRHVDLMGAVVEAYAIPDPMESDEPGVYQDPDLSALHAQLVTAADVSLTAALSVGALIEETDIADLQRALEDAPPADVADVYTRLLGASQNHLRAFVRALADEGETYVPQVMPQAEFDATLAATPTHGRGQGSGDCDGSGQGQGQGRGRGQGNGNGNGRGHGQGRGR